jgi:hypothetical protein
MVQQGWGEDTMSDQASRERIQAARIALKAYSKHVSDGDTPEDEYYDLRQEIVMIDLLTDLFHHAGSEGLHMEDLIDTARNHYRHEH